MRPQRIENAKPTRGQSSHEHIVYVTLAYLICVFLPVAMSSNSMQLKHFACDGAVRFETDVVTPRDVRVVPRRFNLVGRLTNKLSVRQLACDGAR